MKLKLITLFIGSAAILLTVLGTTGPRGKNKPPPPPLTGMIHTNMEKPDFNRITKENEWHAAFAPLEVYGSQVTQRAGRIFSTGRDVPSRAEIEKILREINQ